MKQSYHIAQRIAKLKWQWAVLVRILEWRPRTGKRCVSDFRPDRLLCRFDCMVPMGFRAVGNAR